jgi:hypothetical protein
LRADRRMGLAMPMLERACGSVSARRVHANAPGAIQGWGLFETPQRWVRACRLCDRVAPAMQRTQLASPRPSPQTAFGPPRARDGRRGSRSR